MNGMRADQSKWGGIMDLLASINSELGQINRSIEKYLKIIEPVEEEEFNPSHTCFQCLDWILLQTPRYECKHGVSCLRCGLCDDCNQVGDGAQQA